MFSWEKEAEELFGVMRMSNLEEEKGIMENISSKFTLREINGILGKDIILRDMYKRGMLKEIVRYVEEDGEEYTWKYLGCESKEPKELLDLLSFLGGSDVDYADIDFYDGINGVEICIVKDGESFEITVDVFKDKTVFSDPDKLVKDEGEFVARLRSLWNAINSFPLENVRDIEYWSKDYGNKGVKKKEAGKKGVEYDIGFDYFGWSCGDPHIESECTVAFFKK